MKDATQDVIDAMSRGEMFPRGWYDAGEVQVVESTADAPGGGMVSEAVETSALGWFSYPAKAMDRYSIDPDKIVYKGKTGLDAMMAYDYDFIRRKGRKS